MRIRNKFPKENAKFKYIYPTPSTYKLMHKIALEEEWEWHVNSIGWTD
jgi:hypothetical protein